MKLVKVRIQLLIITMLMLNSAFAIDISVTNGDISPTTIPSFSSYTLSFDLNNQGMPPAATPEDAVFLIITINGFDPINVGSILNHTQNGWNCAINTGSIDCDRTFSPSVFTPGTTEPFFIEIGTNSIVTNPDTFNISSSDESGLTEDNFADNSITISSVAGGIPDFDFDDGVTSNNYNGVENQSERIMMDFSVLNLGTEGSAGASINLSHNDFALMIDTQASTIPAGWNCFAQTGGTNCSTGNPISAASTTNFILAYNATQAGLGNYPFNVSIQDSSFSETITGNNGISTNITLASAVPDLEMTIITPNTFPVHVDEGSTTPTPFTFQVNNIGNTVFQTGDVEVFIGHDPLFTVANVQTAALGWSCGPTTGGFICNNSSTMVQPLDQIDISGEVTGYPTGIMEYFSAVFAVVTDLSGDEANAGLDGNNDFDLSIGIVPLDPDLELTKFAKDGPGLANLITGNWPSDTNFYYQIHVNNLSTTAATQVEVNDLLPAGIQFIGDFSGGSWSCLPDPFVNDSTPQGVTCNHPSIPASSPNFAEIIVIEVQPLTIGLKSNTAAVFSSENDSDPTNNDNFLNPSDVNIVNPANDPDVSIDKSFLSGIDLNKTGPEAGQGSLVTYRILVNNNSMNADVATNVVINDFLPLGVTFDSFNELGPNFSCTFDLGQGNRSVNRGSSGTVSCTAPTLPFTGADDGVDITVNVTGSIGDFIDNTATVTADNDATPGNNSSSTGPFEVVAPLPQVDLVMFKDAQTLAGVPASSFAVNEPFNYVLTVGNLGAGLIFADEVLVTDTVPVGIDIVNISSSVGWDCSNSDLPNRVVDCVSTVDIVNGIDYEIILEVKSTVEGNYDNTAFVDLVGSKSSDADLSNNDDNVLVDIVAAGAQVDLNLLKDAQTVGGSTSVDNFLVGESFEYKIVVHNTGPDNAAVGSVEIVDALPSNINLDATPNGVGWDCSATTGTLVKCINTMPIAATSGFLTLIIPASSQVEGDYLNSADVSLVNGAMAVDTDPNNNNGTMNVTINPISGDLTLVKSVIGGSANRSLNKRRGTNTNFAIGDTVTYTLIAQNNSAANSISDVVITDALDTNFLSYEGFIIRQSTKIFSCFEDGASQVTCTNSSGGSMMPGDTFEVEINATAIAAGNNVSNIANLTSLNSGDDFDSNTVLIDIDSGISPTTLAVQKEALVNGSPVTSVAKGAAYSYLVTVENTGNINAENVVLIDNMPIGLIVNSVNATDWSCGNVSQQYTCKFTGLLLPNATSTVEFEVLDNSAANITQLQNVVDVSSDNAPLVSAVNSLNLTQVGLNLNISQNPNPVVENSSFELIVDIVNTGSQSLQGAEIVNILPDGFSYNVQKSGSTCTINGLEMTCNYPNPIEVGTTKSLSIAVNAISQVNTNANYLNVTTLTGSNFPDGIITNTFINVTRDGVLDYTVSIEDNIDPVTVGNSFMYDVSFENTGTLPITRLDFEVAIPSELVLASSNPNTATCTFTNASFNCQSAKFLNLLPGETINMLNLVVSSPSFIGEVTTNVSALADGELNATASQVTTIVPVSNTNVDLSLTKTASAESVTSGETFNWNIEITNHGPDSAQNVSVTDQLPSGFELISATINGNNVCQGKGSDLFCNIGTMANDETKTINLLGTATLDSGELENLASVTSDTQDSDPKNNSDSASILVNPVTPDSADIYVEVTTGSTVIQGGIAQFTVTAGNNGPDSSISPRLSMQASGSINNIILDDGSDWNCQVSNLTAINCQFVGKEMLMGHQSILHVKLDPEEIVSGNQVLGLMATIASKVTSDPDSSNNTSSAEINDQGSTPTEQELLAAMQAALGGIANQQTLKAIENVASYCSNSYESALEGLCDSLYNAAINQQGELLNNVMEQLTPNEVIGQSSSVAEIATAQFRNVGARLSQLRGGGGSGFSTAGLNARYGSGSIPLGMLAYLNEPAEENGDIDTNNSFISPWGFFVNGTISMGERDATGRELGFDFDSYGLTAGVDYRLDATKVLGIALGYANFDSNIEDSAKLKSTGLTLTGYGSFYVNDNFYVDSRISIAKPDFDQSRNIDFDIDDISIHRTAVGKTDANQYSFAMSAGYHFNKNAWNITPNASLNYVKTNIDGFTETGADAYNFIYSEQEIESLVWSAGMKVSKAISLKNGVITPQFDLDYNYESMNDGINIEARFIMAPADEIFIIETDSPDRSYGSAGIGFAYVTSNGKQAYINYRSLFGLEGFSRGTFNLGARFEF